MNSGNPIDYFIAGSASILVAELLLGIVKRSFRLLNIRIEENRRLDTVLNECWHGLDEVYKTERVEIVPANELKEVDIHPSVYKAEQLKKNLDNLYRLGDR